MQVPRGQLAEGLEVFQQTSMAGLEPDMVAYEAMSNASAQRATCGGPQRSSVDVDGWLGARRGHLQQDEQCERPEGDLQRATEVVQ